MIKFFFYTKNYMCIPNFSSIQPELMVLLNLLQYAASMQQYAANGPFAVRAHITVVFLTQKYLQSQIFMLCAGFAATKP